MQTPPDFKPLRVLLADDDSIVLEVVSLLLGAKGIEVLRALGGQEALDILQAIDPLPDVVVVDHQMPGVSGIEIARYIRALPEPRPRVIAMSASPLPEDELAIFDDYLAKPIDRDLLRAAIAGTSISGTSTSGAATARAASNAASTPPAPVLPPSLDLSTVRKLQAIMPPAAIRELYTVYVEDTRQRISELERYSAADDEESLRRCAHALKGAAAMAGVPGVAAIAAGLETGRLLRQDHGKLFHQLRSACDDVELSMIKSAVTKNATGEAT